MDDSVLQCSSSVVKLLIRVINFLGINGPAKNLAWFETRDSHRKSN